VAAAGPPLSLLSLLVYLLLFFWREHTRIHVELKRETAEGGTAQFARMLTYADVCCHMLTSMQYTRPYQEELKTVLVCWRILTYADVC
jgi:hypothetical protein